MAEEARDERVTIPAAINRVRLAVFAIYFTLPAVALSALPVERTPDGDYQTLLGLSVEDGGFAEDPILGVVEALSLGPFQTAGEVYVGLLAATILFIATNAAIIGVSRLVYSMGVYRQVPDRLRRLHPRYGTPWVGILIFGAVAVVTLLPGQADFLGNMYAFGAMLSFTVAHVAVIALRLREPDRERPYRGPGTVRVRGHEIPVFAVVGGTGTGLAFVVVTALNPEVAAAGTLWLALGAVAYVVYRRRQGLDLTSTHRVALTRPVVEHEAEYESVLVAFRGRRPGGRGHDHRRQAGRAAAQRDPRPGHRHGALRLTAGRRAPRPRARRPGHRRARPRPGRPQGQRPRGEGARRPGREADRR